jgi:hypothetical protein
MKIAEILSEMKCWPGHREVGTQPGTGKNKGKRVNDCEKIEEELDDESLFSEAEDDMEDPMAADEEEPTEPEATMDLAAGDDDMSGSAEEKVEQAMDNAEDAFAELKAAFAEIMGDAEGADEEGSSDMDMPADEEKPTEEGYNAFGESVSLKAVSKPTPGEDGENKKSPVSSGSKINNGAKAIKITDGNTAGGTTPSSKEINSGNVNKVGNAKNIDALNRISAHEGEWRGLCRL